MAEIPRVNQSTYSTVTNRSDTKLVAKNKVTDSFVSDKGSVVLGKDLHVKSGANGADIANLRPEMTRIFPDIVKVWKKCGAPTPCITSGNDGRHGGSRKAPNLDMSSVKSARATSDSLHYKNLAIDLRANNVDKAKAERLEAELKKLLKNRGYDVKLECKNTPSQHIHVEYQPKIAAK